jgi:poly [ADP-ribose] polymerase
MHRVPIVDDLFLDHCIARKTLLDTALYEIKAFKADIEDKFKIKSDVPSALDPRVQQVIEMMFNQKTIDRSLVDLGVDVRKMSLITPQSIKEGYGVLQKIEAKLSPAPGQSKDAHEAELKQLSEQYFRLVPHSNSSPSPIKSIDGIKEKSQQLEALTDIEIAQRLLNEKRTGEDLNMNPIDVNYRKLRAQILPLERFRSEFKLIETMVNNTQSKDFFQGKKYGVELLDAFEVFRDGEAERFAPFKKLPHHRLLFHGSRLANFIGILSQGIRIAPPEAPVTGYFLGKGAYFADMVTVSAQYCRTKESSVGLMLLCDIAMGKMLQIAHGKYIAKKDLDKNGFHSVKCVGTKGPDSGYDVVTHDGLIACCGVESKTEAPVSELVHNEYVVYDAAQTSIKYLLLVKVSELEATFGEIPVDAENTDN